MNIKDIAKMAQVSVSTVSKIINNKDKDISEDTRKRVLKIVKEYQYIPYSKVRESLVVKTHIIGLVISSLYSEAKELSYCIEKVAKENGYSLIVSYIDNELSSEEKAINILINKNVEGIIILSLKEELQNIKEIMNKDKIPFVFLQSNPKSNTPSIFYKEEELGYLATEILINSGHRNIGCVLCENQINIKEGYTKALFDNEILIDKDKIFIANNQISAGKIGVKELLNTNITAILCGDSEIACCTYNTLQDIGMNIPKEISIISASDSKINELLNPSLSGIKIPLKKISYEAIMMLIDFIERKKEFNQPIKKIDLEIKNRDSVTQPPKRKLGQGKKIIVVGSMNMDITIKVDNIPTIGETILSSSTDLIPGGKGANQAVGAAKLGGLVYAIGRLGSDNDGKIIYENMVKNSVKTEGIIFDRNSASGKAYINVSSNGESTIVVYPGANNNLDNNQLKKFEYLFNGAKFCLLSMELLAKTVLYTISICKKNNVKIILKPSAVNDLNEVALKDIDYIIPNEKEINILVPNKLTIEEKAEYLYEKGVKNVIVTLGKKGCFFKNHKYSIYIPSADFTPLDTTGGADAFISALAVYLSEGNDILSSISFATYSAGISITRQGVQPALPDRLTLELYQDEINTLINNIK